MGVYAGVDVSSYAAGQLPLWTHDLASLIGTDKDYMASRVAYKLDLRGPAVMIQTACSTSLVAVHHAYQALLSYQCDIALAGGVGIAFPQKAGYIYEEGGILSPDGHCRAFDANARGTVGGDGCGIVVLKRLDEALADGDHIHAVIKAAAINNDGADKIGFTAPSVTGQADVIAMAQEMAGAHPDTIGYVEAHGTGTQLGDPIEVAALTEVFRVKTDRRGYCALGSVKSNMGHMNSAAGVGGLMKAALCLEQGLIPKSLHFDKPNPALDLDASPFYVPRELTPWPRGDQPRRAAVSSFGVGGTNAHAILEEAPAGERGGDSRGDQLVFLSARSAEALDQATQALRGHLESNPELPLADVAFTLLVGRRRFQHRRILTCRDTAHAAQALASPPAPIHVEASRRSVVFLFPGQGAQYPGMTRGLYDREPLYRAIVDELCTYAQARIGVDLRALILGAGRDAAALNQTAHTQPALFVVEYALARLLDAWGVRPDAMIGHSVGEYVAACVAGVMTAEQALDLLAARGRLIQEMPPGGMLAVSLGEDEAASTPGLSVAALNAPDVTVLSGPLEAVDEAASSFGKRGVACTRLHTSHAFHSTMMEPMLERFRGEVESLELLPPRLPFVSNVTGVWITDTDATDPDYWVQHIRRPVRFSEGVRMLLAEPDPLFLEVGPGRNLSGLVVKQAPELRGRVLTTVRHPQVDADDATVMVECLGRLHAEGAEVDWEAFYDGERRRRVPLPTYPFQRERYWEDRTALRQELAPTLPVDSRPEDWVWAPTWQRAPVPSAPRTAAGGALLVLDGDDPVVGAAVAEIARGRERVLKVVPGCELRQRDDGRFEVDPQRREHWEELLKQVPPEEHLMVLDLWGLQDGGTFEEAQDRSLYPVLRLGQVMGGRGTEILVAARGTADVTGSEPLRPEAWPVRAAARILPQELPGLRCRVVDTLDDGDLSAALVAESGCDGPPHVAYRNGQRWIEAFSPAGSVLPAEGGALREEGVYLVTGGLGRIGLDLAERLAPEVRGLVLTSRSGLVAREEWDGWLSSHRDDDAQSRRIRRIRTMEDAGAEVEVLSADVADPERMRYVLARIEERFGRLDGVIHAAGLPGGQAFRAAVDTDPSHFEAHFRAKVRGAEVLAQLLPGDLDFVLLLSSLSTAVGGAGLLAYAAANHYLDALASARGAPWISVGLDAWGRASDDASSAFGLPSTEGVGILERVLARPDTRRWLVSTVPLRRRMTDAARARPAREHIASGAAPERHPRPELGTAYVAPRDEDEEIVASIWEEVLGIDGIGVDDSFFKLGGDSLMAIQIGTRLRDSLDVEVPINELFQDPTVAGVARAVGAARSGATSSDEGLADTLAMVESMSDEEVRRMLAKLEGDR
ncbi:MAG: SDR family oxidoreductase [Gemmatimonadota bacterium]